MSLLPRLRAGASALSTRDHMERELEEEMRFHLENEIERNIKAGLSPTDARRKAMVDFGGVERYKEEVRDARGARLIEDLRHDLRYAWRTLANKPAFTIVAALTLALGIGATTTLFGVVKAALLTPLPYREPESVALIWSAWKGFDRTWISYDEFEAYDSSIPAFENVGLFSDGAVNITEGDQPERIRVSTVDRDVFSILGVSPVLGRSFTKEEDTPGGPNVIILGYDLWKHRYNADSAIIGKQIQIGGQASTVVGVMPDGFKMPLDYGAVGTSLAFLPIATDAARNGAVPGPEFSKQGQSHGYYAVARLRKGNTIAQANSQITALLDKASKDGVYPPTMQFHAFSVSAVDQVTGRVKPVLLIVFGAVGFVLLIACANVAGLLLVRGEARRREFAVRVALGASDGRLVRQLLTESIVVAALGGTLGVLFAAGAVAAVRQAAPTGLARVTETHLDMPVLLFAVGISVLAALLAGLLPAFQSRRSAPAGDLKDGGRAATASASRIRWRQVLVAIEVALAVVLVSGAGLMVRTVANLFSIDAGIDPHNVLTMRLSTPATFYRDSATVASFYNELLRKVREIPGVKSAGTARILPLATEMGDWGVRVEGFTPPPNQGTPADWQVITPGYFEAMGLSLKQGRFIDQRDELGAPLSLVVNEEFVKRYLAGQNPLGRKVIIGGAPDSLAYSIVGVVGNVRHNGLTREVKAQFYAPLGQFARTTGSIMRSATLVVRTVGDPAAMTPRVRAVIREMDPRLPVSEIRTMDDVLAASISEPRFAMGLLSLFGLLALVLSSVGIFGIVAQLVSARSHEFGIRAALGASPRELVMLSVRSGLGQTFAGLVVGVFAALALTRIMRSLLEGVTPTDPKTFATVVTVTAVTALLATVGPARRAGRVDPMTVLNDS